MLKMHLNHFRIIAQKDSLGFTQSHHFAEREKKKTAIGKKRKEKNGVE